MAAANGQKPKNRGPDLRRGRFEKKARIQVSPKKDIPTDQPIDENIQIRPEIAKNIIRPGGQDFVKKDRRISADDIGNEGQAEIPAEIGNDPGRRRENDLPVKGRRNERRRGMGIEENDTQPDFTESPAIDFHDRRGEREKLGDPSGVVQEGQVYFLRSDEFAGNGERRAHGAPNEPLPAETGLGQKPGLQKDRHPAGPTGVGKAEAAQPVARFKNALFDGGDVVRGIIPDGTTKRLGLDIINVNADGHHVGGVEFDLPGDRPLQKPRIAG